MDRETLEKLIDAAARYGDTKVPAARDEIRTLNQRLAEFRYLGTLQNALERCRDFDVRTVDVKSALDELAKAIPESWPVNQFSEAKRSITTTRKAGGSSLTRR